MPKKTNELPENPFEKLIEILALLRGPGGCPWDKEQTYKDINPYMLEEAHEVVDAIDAENFDDLKEELGDLLMHIFFHAQLAREENRFTISEVVEANCEKLIRRHPHVFGDTKADTTKAVLENWEQIKGKEKGKERKSLLDGLPKAVPALVKAFRIGEKTSRVGFDWENRDGVLTKVEEELTELKEAIRSGNENEIEKEYGDVLLVLANLGRFTGHDPETALRKAILKFTRRFQKIEEQFGYSKSDLKKLSAEKWNTLWEAVKNSESSLASPPFPE